MESLVYFFVFLFGLIVGSFLNCVIYRLETGRSFLQGRSFCPHCKHQLSFWDLIPVFSFLFLGGKCRYCYQKISWQYPLVELATGIIFFQTATIVSNISTGVYLLLIIPFLVVIFVYDLKHYIIPDKVIYPAIAIVGIFNFQIINFLSAILAASFFLVIVLASRGKGMGIGDIKLAFFMGLFLGWPSILVALFLAFLTGAIIGTGLIISKNKTLKSEVPFGPFLVVGTFIALFYGNQIINWYLSLFI